MLNVEMFGGYDVGVVWMLGSGLNFVRFSFRGLFVDAYTGYDIGRKANDVDYWVI